MSWNKGAYRPSWEHRHGRRIPAN